MRRLYLVYRVNQYGEQHPETIMGLEDQDFKAAAEALDRLMFEDNPEMSLREGERWVFVPQEEAALADWEEIAPPDSRSLPY